MPKLEYLVFIVFVLLFMEGCPASSALLPMAILDSSKHTTRMHGRGARVLTVPKIKGLKYERDYIKFQLSYSKEDHSEERISAEVLRSRTIEEQTFVNGTEATTDNLGDIMTTPVEIEEIKTSISPLFRNNVVLKSENKATQGGLKTTSGGSLQARFGVTPPFSALDRIALTANGNLQRIVSSFYDSPVTVVVNSCVERPRLCASENAGVWDRSVDLKVYNKRFCRATSEITVHEPMCAELVRSGEVGLGQLFRYLDKLPTFDLLDAGRTESGGMWRLYELKSKELTCSIFEDFSPDVWSMMLDDHFNEHDNCF
uniref:Uncharacterized protein n=1 Tax=Leptocylindrus danicus TaxID=163516 RepID=A0A7S2L0C0_9STRA|mmetsp:Transcript_29121/g.42760  ORF Transcript_29121/g.42760 Transcript_29121/m.42760 type:complete len:314 (+) Transcript_29121:87-1028(+)